MREPSASQSPAAEIRRFSPEAEAPTFSLVTLSYNQPHYTDGFLDSLAAVEEAERFELIVVDNGSQGETVAKLRARLSALPFPSTLIVNERNLGYPKGCNQGLALSRGSHLVLVNNDVLVSDGWLSRFRQALDADERVGLVGPVANSVAGAAQIAIDYREVSLQAVRAFACERRRRFAGQQRGMPHLTGFCVAFRRALYEQLGGLDEAYFAGWEDLDYSLRAREQGFRCLLLPDVYLHHFGGGTRERTPECDRHMDREHSRLFYERWARPALQSFLPELLAGRFRRLLTFKTMSAETLGAIFSLLRALESPPRVDLVTSATSTEAPEARYDFTRVFRFPDWDFRVEALDEPSLTALSESEYDLVLVNSYSFFGENLKAVAGVLGRVKPTSIAVFDQTITPLDPAACGCLPPGFSAACRPPSWE